MEDGYLRNVTEEDADLLFEWANEAAVRKNSFVTKPIRYEEHIAWFRQILHNTDCRQYIYMFAGEAIGQVRVTINGDAAEIGYSICKEKRGQGQGGMLLSLLKSQVKRDFPQIRKLTGKVKPDNAASQRAFIKAGFEAQYFVYETLV